MRRYYISQAIGAVIYFVFFFLFYRYGEKESIAVSVRFGIFVAIFNTLIMHFLMYNLLGSLIIPIQKEKEILSILEKWKALKVKKKNNTAKYKLAHKKWPFNVLRTHTTGFNLYIYANIKTIKHLENELKREDLV